MLEQQVISCANQRVRVERRLPGQMPELRAITLQRVTACVHQHARDAEVTHVRSPVQHSVALVAIGMVDIRAVAQQQLKHGVLPLTRRHAERRVRRVLAH
jgi:hypothetical protein